MTAAAVDLHVHSRFSDRPTEWLLQRLGAPESYTDPLLVYRRCRERGMTLVTLTDHDTIDGAAEIAHLPGTFVSCEVTVLFPEDGCPFHLLVFGIDEQQHREIQRLRANVYELRDHLYDRRIAHSVAHPLSAVDHRMRPEHVEKLFVLFKCFEGLNGAYGPRGAMVTRAMLDNLTPRQVDDLANRHRIDPRDPQPWRKHLTAGSDDHCGLYVASAWSSLRADGAMTPRRFLEGLRRGELAIEGVAGSSLQLGRGIHRIAARYARSRRGGDDGTLPLLGWLSDRIVAAGAASRPIGPEPVGGATHARSALPEFVTSAVSSEIASPVAEEGAAEAKSYRLATRIAQRLLIEGVWRATAALQAGEVGGALDALRALLPTTLAVAPYLVAYRTQHRDEPLVRAVAERFPAARLLRERSGRTAWFRDSFDAAGDDGAALAVALDLAGGAERLRVLHLPGGAIGAGSVASTSFRPLGDLGMARARVGAGAPAIEIPPVLELLEYCERERFDRVLISGAGPMAAAARCVASCLELELAAMISLPAHQRLSSATSDLLHESALESYLRWLYRPAREILALDDGARSMLERAGISARRPPRPATQPALLAAETGARELAAPAC